MPQADEIPRKRKSLGFILPDVSNGINMRLWLNICSPFPGNST